jgi:hypothetical protein
MGAFAGPGKRGTGGDGVPAEAPLELLPGHRQQAARQ